MKHEIRYGKADVKVYRTHAEPLTGITPIPESPFTGRENILAAAEIEVVVHGTQFLDAYTKGDNRLVVATDTMKNFIHAASLTARCPSARGVAARGRHRLPGHLPAHGAADDDRRASCPSRRPSCPPRRDGFEASDRLFSRDRCDAAAPASSWPAATTGAVGHHRPRVRPPRPAAHQDHRLRLRRLRPRRAHDPARAPDRPLYIWCNIGWRYADASHAVLADPARYVAAEQVADLAIAVFHEFVSLSIQHLVNEIGARMLDRWPQLAEVSFDAQNRLWDLGGRVDRGPDE